MNEKFNRLNADERAFARALQAAVRPATPPDARRLDGLFDRLTQSMRREEERMWLSDSLRALRRCAAAVIILVVSLAFGFRSTNSLVAELTQESAPEQVDRLAHLTAKAQPAIHAAPAALLCDADTDAGMQQGQMIQPFAASRSAAPQALAMQAEVTDGVSPFSRAARSAAPQAPAMQAEVTDVVSTFSRAALPAAPQAPAMQAEVTDGASPSPRAALPAAPQALAMQAEPADSASPSPRAALPASPRTMTMRARTGAAPQPKLHLDILPL